MKTKWQVTINGDLFTQETITAAVAIRYALKDFCKKHGRPYKYLTLLQISVSCEKSKGFPYTKVA